MELKRRPGRPKKTGPLVTGAGIALTPGEIELLDKLMVRFRVRSRAEVVRRLIDDHPVAKREQAA